VCADSCLARGDAETAIATARETIAAADAGGAWFQGAVARAAAAEALVRAGAASHDIAAMIADARELVRKSVRRLAAAAPPRGRGPRCRPR
jgi:hypothetical protein